MEGMLECKAHDMSEQRGQGRFSPGSCQGWENSYSGQSETQFCS